MFLSLVHACLSIHIIWNCIRFQQGVRCCFQVSFFSVLVQLVMAAEILNNITNHHLKVSRFFMQESSNILINQSWKLGCFVNVCSRVLQLTVSNNFTLVWFFPRKLTKMTLTELIHYGSSHRSDTPEISNKSVGQGWYQLFPAIYVIQPLKIDCLP